MGWVTGYILAKKYTENVRKQYDSDLNSVVDLSAIPDIPTSKITADSDLDMGGHNLENSKLVKSKWQNFEAIYVSPTGGGDGSSSSSPTTLDDALTRAKARQVYIYLDDGEYHISTNYTITADFISINSLSGDPSSCKIVFDTYLVGTLNASYSLRIYGNTVLRFQKVTLENAPKADTNYGWAVGGGAYAPISIAGDTSRQGVVMILNCVINQSRDYFISAKHGVGGVILSGTTINMSEDAVAFISNEFGIVQIGWYNSSITSGYKLTTGLQGRDVLFSGIISNVSASSTWFSAVPETVKPLSDNSYDLGSSSYRWAKVYATTVYAYGDNNKLAVYSDSLGGIAGSMEYDPTSGSILFRSPFSKPFRFAQSVLPSGDNSFNLGTSSLRWANAYIVNLYTGDLCFEEKTCEVCGKPFKEGDVVVLKVKKVDDYTRTVPVHMKCGIDNTA